ncbi:MAG: hypothetical protein JSS43_15365 [Proteobacteria bacterium]|nr:hypothetical protein [Pseudomonadota bacterium]
MEWYQIAKDFAGPVATVIAASAAGLITWIFASRQAKIAEQQAQTAVDQLRHNLFERRYALYSSIQELLRMMLFEHNEQDPVPRDLSPYYIAIKEARFFFSPSFCVWLQTVWDLDIMGFIAARADPGSQQFSDAMKRLLAVYNEMPERFSAEMMFSQLTRQRDG